MYTGADEIEMVAWRLPQHIQAEIEALEESKKDIDYSSGPEKLLTQS